MNVTYVEFLLPGSFVSETIRREVSNRNHPTDIPKNAFAYRFFDREVVVTSETLKGPLKNFSDFTYFGTELTLEDVQSLPNAEVLKSNMKTNGWERVVKTKMGNFQPLRSGDVVLSQ